MNLQLSEKERKLVQSILLNSLNRMMLEQRHTWEDEYWYELEDKITTTKDVLKKLMYESNKC